MTCQLLNGKLFSFEIHLNNKVTAQNEERSLSKRQRGLSFEKKTDKVWSTVVQYLVQYLSFTSVRTDSKAAVKGFDNCAVLLRNRKAALCPAAACVNQGLLRCSPSFDMFPHAEFSVLGVFALLQAYAFLQYLKHRLTRQEFQTLFFLGVSLAAGVVFLTVIYLTYTGTYAWTSATVIIT